MDYSLAARKALTEAFEGLRLTAYPDPASGGDPWTIGYGHTGRDVVPGLVITAQQADALLVADIAAAIGAVRTQVKAPLTQHQFDALVDFTFNVGAGNLQKSSLLRLVNAGLFAQADLEFAKWVKAAGKIMPGLVARRAGEAKWFATLDDTDPTPTGTVPDVEDPDDTEGAERG